MLLNTIDILKGVGSCAFFVLVTLVWIHGTRQTQVARTRQTTIEIVTRIIVLHVVVIALLCIWFRIPINYLGVFVIYVVFIVPFANFDSPPGSDIVTVALTLLFILPAYVIRQFVLGFPDLIAPDPQSEQAFVLEEQVDVGAVRQPAFSHLESIPNGIVVTVISPLKPIGFVDVNGERMDAITIDGSLLDVGQTAWVCGRQNRRLVVKPMTD